MKRSSAKWAVTAALCAVCVFARAQDPELNMDALENGTLIIWVIKPPLEKRPKSNVPQYKAADPGYHEATTGGLGQPSSSFGHDAASYGVDASSPTISAPSSPTAVNARAPGDVAPADSGYVEVTGNQLGQPSSTFGTNQSDHGQSAGSFGQNAGAAGQNAGGYGTDVGSFGDSLSTVAQPKKQQAVVSTFHLPMRGPSTNAFEQEIHAAFPSLKVLYADVYADELAGDLAAASNSRSAPDILIGALNGAGWRRMEGRYGAAMVRRADYVPDGVSSGEVVPEYALAANATHPAAARAFILWASEVNGGCLQCGVATVAANLNAEEQKVATAASAAIGHLFAGEGAGTVADGSMAIFSPQLGSGVLKNDAGQTVNEGAKQTIVHVSVNGKLAAVTARVVVSSGGEYGVAHPLVVLRENAASQWKVLHVSLNLPALEAERARQELTSDTSPPQRQERIDGVKGVTLTAPDNGDTREAQPSLGWDNHGGAGLQVVEWAACNSDCLDTHLYFVPDNTDHLRTEVNAEFANAAGRYKWRVWSVGDDGAMAISSWRTFVVEQ